MTAIACKEDAVETPTQSRCANGLKVKVALPFGLERDRAEQEVTDQYPPKV